MHFVPRAILIDTEPDLIDKIRSQTNLFDNYSVVGGSGADGNWATGFYSLGNQYGEQIMDKIRKNVEKQGNCQGFQLSHSNGGGTGSGLGAYIIEKIRAAYPSKET